MASANVQDAIAIGARTDAKPRRRRPRPRREKERGDKELDRKERGHKFGPQAGAAVVLEPQRHNRCPIARLIMTGAAVKFSSVSSHSSP
jgi:hypothetical protein